MESLRGRGGGRSWGFEENGFARKPPAHIVIPPRAPKVVASSSADAAAADAGAATGASPVAAWQPPTHGSVAAGYMCGAACAIGSPSVATAAPAGSRHRFELVGLDFMVDDDLHVWFIEVSSHHLRLPCSMMCRGMPQLLHAYQPTPQGLGRLWPMLHLHCLHVLLLFAPIAQVNSNPSLSPQCPWHEEFVDEMAVRTLDLVFDGVFEPSTLLDSSGAMRYSGMPASASSSTGAATGAAASGSLAAAAPAPAASAAATILPSSAGRYRPATGWQFLMNVYTAAWKLPAERSTDVAARMAAAGASKAAAAAGSAAGGDVGRTGCGRTPGVVRTPASGRTPRAAPTAAAGAGTAPVRQGGARSAHGPGTGTVTGTGTGGAAASRDSSSKTSPAPPSSLESSDGEFAAAAASDVDTSFGSARSAGAAAGRRSTGGAAAAGGRVPFAARHTRSLRGAGFKSGGIASVESPAPDVAPTRQSAVSAIITMPAEGLALGLPVASAAAAATAAASSHAVAGSPHVLAGTLPPLSVPNAARTARGRIAAGASSAAPSATVPGVALPVASGPTASNVEGRAEAFTSVRHLEAGGKLIAPAALVIPTTATAPSAPPPAGPVASAVYVLDAYGPPVISVATAGDDSLPNKSRDGLKRLASLSPSASFSRRSGHTSAPASGISSAGGHSDPSPSAYSAAAASVTHASAAPMLATAARTGTSASDALPASPVRAAGVPAASRLAPAIHS